MRTLLKFRHLFVSALLLATGAPCTAQARTPAEANAAIADAAAASASGPVASPNVTRVWNAMDASPKGNSPVTAGLGDHLFVEVSNLEEVLKRLKAEQPQHEWILYLNGLPIKGVAPESIGNPQNTLRFHLRRTDASKDAWVALLGKPRALTKEVKVGVGIEGEPVSTMQTVPLNLIVVRERRLYFWVFFIIVVVVGMFLLGSRSSLLRDSDALGLPPNAPRPFSLARSQAAFWFVLVLAAYTFLWLVTGSADTLTASVLGLMGISAAAAAGAAVIDSGKQDAAAAEADALRTRALELAAKISDLTRQLAAVPPPSNAEALRLELAAAQAEHDRVNVLLAPPAVPAGAIQPLRRNFYMDWISDANGVSLHRFQLVIWTAVLGIIFVYAVDENLAMPEFSATLLGLMGISTATYVGLKVPEKQE